MAKKMKKDPEQLARIYRNLGDRIDFTLAKLVEDGKPVAPAMATAAQNYLRLHEVDDEIKREAAEEAQAAASVNYEFRITLTGADASLEAMCEAHGLTTDDLTNIAARARREAAKCEEDSQERQNYLAIAQEAEERMQGE